MVGPTRNFEVMSRFNHVISKIGPLNSNLDGNQDIKYKKKFAIFDIRWCKNTVISNIDA